MPNVLADTPEAHKENYDAMIERADKLRAQAKRAYKHGDIYTTKAGDVQDHADVYHKQFCSQVDPNLSWQNTSRPTSFITLT